MNISTFKSNFPKSILIYSRTMYLVIYPCYETSWSIGLYCEIFMLKDKNIPTSFIARESFLKFYPTDKYISVRYKDGSTSINIGRYIQ